MFCLSFLEILCNLLQVEMDQMAATDLLESKYLLVTIHPSIAPFVPLKMTKFED